MAVLRDSVNEALKAAMKSRDAARTSTLRMMTAAFKDRDIEARGAGKPAVADDELLASLAKMIRKREESAKVSTTARGPACGEERAEIE